jgi:hypothetical protein
MGAIALQHEAVQIHGEINHPNPYLGRAAALQTVDLKLSLFIANNT